jgi:formimidoylglutamate deiminase
MKTFFLKALLTETGWISDAYVSVDSEGKITVIGTDKPDGEVISLKAFAVPGFQNAHSHSFQYAMAGLAEKHSTGQLPDDFWSWRDAMYQLALSVSPDHLENIAAMLYSEMLRHGYTDVAEFHYVHHDKNGKPFDNLSEMGERLVAAAKKVGIGITLVPIFYQKGGFGKAPTEGQKRFISADLDSYYMLLEASKKSTAFYDNANVAIGIHSMRGVEHGLIAEIAKNGDQNIPFHIHISEQLKEIEDSISYIGKRPVEWMLDNVSMSERYHLVHATHLTKDETKRLAESKANVVLCPSTEGNLGDGIFPLKSFQNFGGKWSIGTDSHIGLNPIEELKLLDYGQRLISHKRNTFYSSEEGDSGFYGIKMSLIAGRKAMNNFENEFFKVGEYFDAALFDAEAPLLSTAKLENLSSSIVYSSDVSMQIGTISKGIEVVKNGKHLLTDEIRSNFSATMIDLGNR